MKIRILPVATHAVEDGAWDSVRQGWRQIYGDFSSLGVSVEAHRFWTAEPLDWARSFHPRSLEICLNFAGYGRITTARETLEFFPRTAGFYRTGETIREAVRAGGEAHQFLTLEMTPEFVSRHLEKDFEDLTPAFQQFIHGKSAISGEGSQTAPFSARVEHIGRMLRQSPASEQNDGDYEMKIVELLGEVAFVKAGERFCARQQRLSRERVEQVVRLLRDNLSEPPALTDIALQTGCSPFHLSRIFSAETGRTIPQYLRKLRMERASELIRNEKRTVPEAAGEVGYASLSHFAKAYAEVFGHGPKAAAARQQAA